MSQRYPLTWPNGWPRTPGAARRNLGASNQRSLDDAIRSLGREIDSLRIESAQLSSNIPIRFDGSLKASECAADPGVALYFVRKKKNHCIPCDTYRTVKDNVRAIALTLEALRGMERWGTSAILDRAFEGFMALGPASATWREVLGLNGNATVASVEARFRELVKTHHPDVGGDEESMRAIVQARKEALTELGAC